MNEAEKLLLKAFKKRYLDILSRHTCWVGCYINRFDAGICEDAYHHIEDLIKFGLMDRQRMSLQLGGGYLFMITEAGRKFLSEETVK